ncbi:hypothetical protein [Planctobacterium marinum]|uniref:Uncharacterized protein n=1 Tax=Planctobacterium marinum TaxID=1631968 RepID=A0AA48HIQ5_9ALTE|nr:hypothetical protein MACH26_15450 [Planctobacterium marinum]
MKKHVVLLLLTALVSGLAFAQQGTNEQKDNSEERIEVLGQRTPTHYYKAMRRAEIDLYDQVNKMLTNDKYKISCERETYSVARNATRLKKKYCLPKFVRERMGEETRKALEDGVEPPTLEQVELMVADEQEEALNAVAKVIEENPKLLELLIKYHTSAANYENVKAQYASDKD